MKRYLHASFPPLESRVLNFQMPLPDTLSISQIVALHEWIDLAKRCGATGFYTQTEVIQ